MTDTGPPLDDAIPWAEQRVGDRVLHVRSLPGATSSDVYHLTLTRNEPVVLRLFTGSGWLAVEPDLAEHEAAALRLMDSNPVPTPRLLGVDPDGSQAGVPAVLMSELPGRIHLLPVDLDAWLTALAEPLGHLSSVETGQFEWAYRTWQDLDSLEVPPWSGRADVWEDVFAAVREDPPPSPIGLLHRDYHPTNVLWLNGELSGVIDWVNACVGPAGIDVGHCRLNLAAMYGPDVADTFTDKIEALTSTPHFPHWDLLSVVDWLPEPTAHEPWAEFGLTGIDPNLMRDRLEEFVTRAIRQLV